MRRASGVPFALLALPVAAAATEEALRLPSGLTAELQEVLTDRQAGAGLVYRFRFFSDEFDTAAASDPEKVAADLEWLCENYASPRLAKIGPQPGRVVISLADKPSEFGVYSHDITQVFEVFSLQGDTCIWEVF